MIYFAQGIGFVGMLLIFIAFQQNDKKKILIIQACAGAVFTVHFVLLGAYTGACLNAIEVFRNLVFCKKDLKGRKFYAVAFMVLFTAFGLIYWESIYSIMPIMAMNLSTLAFNFKNPKQIRLCFLPVAVGWLIYNIVSFSIAGIVTEIFDIASLLIAFWRFDVPADNRLKRIFTPHKP